MTQTNTILCPVCETENAPDAINCEVCGERLAPLAPGEELAPEENVASLIQNEATELTMPQSSDSELEPVFELSESSAEENATLQGIPKPTDDLPDVLYSPLTGEAYPQSSSYYREGFGPMGEQLVATPPVLEEAAPAASTEAPEAQESFPPEPEAEEYVLESMPEEEELILNTEEPILEEPVAQPEPPATPAPAPSVTLPKPGPLSEPATLTLYSQKQPVLTFDITTDETLIGRRDIRADIQPDIDLTQWDGMNLVSRKHAYVYRQNKNYVLYAISQGGVQVNSDLLELGDRRTLADGDIIVIAGFLAIKFKLPALT